MEKGLHPCLLFPPGPLLPQPPVSPFQITSHSEPLPCSQPSSALHCP